MIDRKIRIGFAAAAMTALSWAPAWAQGAPVSRGWPGATVSAPARAARPEAAPSAAAVSTPKRVETPRPSAPRVASTPERVAEPTLVEALKTQSALLAQLAATLDADRRALEDQRRELAQLKAQMAAAPAAVRAEPVPPAAKPAAPAPALTVDTAGAKLRLAGLVQGWFSYSRDANSFRLRRTEVKISGEINARTKWTVMLDPVKSTAALQDAFISLQQSPALTVELGQQKLPFGYEGTVSSSRLDTVDRGLFMTRGTGFGDNRDLGVTVRGKSGQFEYAGGVFNGLGESMNTTDKDTEKAVAGRVVFRPRAVSGLHVGGSLSSGTIANLEAARRTRRGLEAAYARGLFTARAELALGEDGDTPRGGYYTQAAIRLARPVQALVRYDVWDPDTRTNANAATVAERDWIAGLNWNVAGQNALLQINYVRKTFGGIQASRDVVLANLQTAW